MKKAEMSHSVLPAARPRALTRTAAIFTVALGFALNAIGARAEGNAVRFGPNLLLSDETRSPQVANRVESTIAANPLDLANLVAGYQVFGCQMKPCACRVVATHDGGATWSLPVFAPLSTPADHCRDSSLAADLAGTFYYSYLDQTATPNGLSEDLRVAVSNDGGGSFSRSSAAVHDAAGDFNSIDKPWITVDAQPKSKFKGTVYVSYTQAEGFLGAIAVVRSQDGGSSWSDPVIVSPIADGAAHHEVQGSVPVVAPDGTVYVFYAAYNPLTGPLSIQYAKSRDGGRSWTAPATVASGLNSPGLFVLNNGMQQFGSASFIGIFANSFPTVAIPPDGTIFVAWTDFPNGSCVNTGTFSPPCVNADVRLSVSKDGGRSWSPPAKVSDETNATDQFFPAIAAHPSSLLSLVWLDRRLDPDNLNYDAFYTNTLGGAAFLPNVRVSSATSTVDSNTDLGDYQGLAVTGNSIVPAWCDDRMKAVNIFTAVGTIDP